MGNTQKCRDRRVHAVSLASDCLQRHGRSAVPARLPGEIANEEGMVFVIFGDTPLPVDFEDKECRDLDDVETPRSDTDRFALM